jgi:hypothetical protein
VRLELVRLELVRLELVRLEGLLNVFRRTPDLMLARVGD